MYTERVNGREIAYLKCCFNKEETLAAGFEDKILREAKEAIGANGGEYCRGPEKNTYYSGNNSMTRIGYTVIYYKKKLN